MCFFWKRKKKSAVIKSKPGKGWDRLNAGDEEKEVKTLKKEDQPEKYAEVFALIDPTLKLIPSNFQHVGDRERQEDSFAFSDLSDSDYVASNGVLAVVADGMGGLARGDRASQVAVNTFMREYQFRSGEAPIEQNLQKALYVANCAVYDLAYDGSDKEIELGTTFVAAAFFGGKMHWVSVGDSQIFHYHDGQLAQLNLEHIYANKLKKDVKKGLISKKEADEHPEKAYLTSYLGLHDIPEVDLNEEPVALNPGDVVLLCSDGLTNTLTREEITSVLESNAAGVAEKLVEKALSKKVRYQDNITVLAVTCEPVEDLSMAKEIAISKEMSEVKETPAPEESPKAEELPASEELSGTEEKPASEDLPEEKEKEDKNED